MAKKMPAILSAVLIAAAICLRGNIVWAQDSTSIPYFPYQIGDELVYRVYYPDFPEPEWQDDYKLTITRDSVGEDGTRFISLENEGFSPPIATGFKVDTLGNVYAAKWGEFPEYWKVLDTSKGIDEPWIASQDTYELGNIKESYSDETFGVISEVLVIDIYSSEDSLATWGYTRNTTWWKSEIGIVEKFSSEGGPVYVLKGALINGTVYGDTTAMITSIEPMPTLPETFILYQNYPNPFNPTTNITFTLPERSQVSLVVYDLLGREVATLVSETLPAGDQSVKFDATGLANGIYLYKLRSGNRQIIRKMTLIK